LGSAVAARYLERVPAGLRPRTYAFLGVGTAGFALAFPWLLRAGLPPLAALYVSGAASPLVLESARLGLSAALLLVPTTLMGMTLPLLVALTGARVESAGRPAGALHRVNTVGASARAPGRSDRLCLRVHPRHRDRWDRARQRGRNGRPPAMARAGHRSRIGGGRRRRRQPRRRWHDRRSAHHGGRVGAGERRS